MKLERPKLKEILNQGPFECFDALLDIRDEHEPLRHDEYVCRFNVKGQKLSVLLTIHPSQKLTTLQIAEWVELRVLGHLREERRKVICPQEER